VTRLTTLKTFAIHFLSAFAYRKLLLAPAETAPAAFAGSATLCG
jgi:hypothetical protein